jgi:DNA-directed RNA polymerase subunit K/omega
MSDSEAASIFEEDIFAIDEDDELENNFADGDEATEAEINSDIEEQADTFDEMADVPTQSTVKKIDASETLIPDVISKYQLIPLIIARVKQLNDGCRPFVKMNNGETDPEKIAIAEIVNNRFPLCLLINGNIVCRMSHFTHFPSDIMETMEQLRAVSSPL